MRTGIEIEFWVVDEQGRLCDGNELTDAHERVEPEFVGPLVEVKTEPHEREHALRRDLRETLVTVIRAAESVGKRLVPLGTPLTAADVPATGERGRLFERIYGDGVQSAKNCAGTHIHFEKKNVTRQLNLLTALDPALALVNSSPYYLGERKQASSRAAAYRTKCGAEFEQFCALMTYTGSVEEWQERVENRFEAFRSLAAEAGVRAERVEEHFSPEDTVLNPVRLRRSQPTVEWRAPDSALPSQVVRLATDVSRLVRQTDTKPLRTGAAGVHADHISVPEFDALYDVSREAIRWGLGSKRVHDHLERMRLDPSTYQPICEQLQGPGTLRESEARKIRLLYAERLRSDVAGLTEEPVAPLTDREGEYVRV